MQGLVIFHHHHNYEQFLNKAIAKQGLFIFKMCERLLGDELIWREKECLSHSWKKFMHSLSLFTSSKHPYLTFVQIPSKCRLLYLPEVVNNPNQVKLNWRYYSSILISWESEELCPPHFNWLQLSECRQYLCGERMLQNEGFPIDEQRFSCK